MSILPVGASLACLQKPEPLEKPGHFARLQNGNRTHAYATWINLNSDELGLELRLAVFEQHFHDFAKVLPQLVKGRPLTMGAGQPGTWPTYSPVSGSRSTTTLKV